MNPELRKHVYSVRRVLVEQFPRQCREGHVDPSEWTDLHGAAEWLAANSLGLSERESTGFNSLLLWVQSEVNGLLAWMRETSSSDLRDDDSVNAELRSRFEELWANYDRRALELLGSDNQPSNVAPSPQEAQPTQHDTQKWDVFVSHASEDKDSFVRPLAQALTARGLRVWFDEQTLTLGDSLRRRIDQGLACSRFGVVVLSPAFFSKEWPQIELDGLAALEKSGRKVILPVWHNLGQEEVAQSSATLAARLAVSSTKGIEAVVDAIEGAIAASAVVTRSAEPTTLNESGGRTRNRAKFFELGTLVGQRLAMLPVPDSESFDRFARLSAALGVSMRGAFQQLEAVGRSIQEAVEKGGGTEMPKLVDQFTETQMDLIRDIRDYATQQESLCFLIGECMANMALLDVLAAMEEGVDEDAYRGRLDHLATFHQEASLPRSANQALADFLGTASSAREQGMVNEAYRRAATVLAVTL